MRAKKSLGQNFFVNKSLAEKIVEITTAENPSKVLEIGPGTGSFTNLLIKYADLTVIEKDNELAANLERQYNNITVINSDFLDLSHDELTKLLLNTIVFGSLPYNVSKVIIKMCIENPNFTAGYFIIQKEVAEKYAEKENDSSVLSLTTQLYANVEILFDISSGSFRPKPKVTSTFVKFTKNNILENIRNKDLLIRIIKDAFSHPRKKLRNNLKSYTFDSPLLDSRAQDLSLQDYINLSDSLGDIMTQSGQKKKKEKE